jgi:probable HAF family extracellular repeat protein
MSDSRDINNAGQVVGYRQDPPEGFLVSRAYITGPNGQESTLIKSLGGDFTYAFGINEAGRVAGGSYTDEAAAGGLEHAFITGPNGLGMTDLGTLAEKLGHIEGERQSLSRAAGSSMVAAWDKRCSSLRDLQATPNPDPCHL